jgi:hypothetical protein
MTPSKPAAENGVTGHRGDAAKAQCNESEIEHVASP